MVAPNLIFFAMGTSPQLTGRDFLWRLLSVLLLIAINAFFVTAEFAILSVRRSRISQLVEAGDLQAQNVQSLQLNIKRLLSTTQIGITLSSLALGWIGENTLAGLLKYIIVPQPLNPLLVHTTAMAGAFFLLAYLQIVLGELCPKSLAIIYSEQLARLLGPPSLAIARIFNPFIWILNQSTHYLLGLFGVEYTGQGWYKQVTPEELQLIITTERESTGLEAEERELLNNVFEFSEVLAGEVMVPRTSLVSIPSTVTFATLLNKVAATNHSRYPVTGESLDDIQGIIDFKELAKPLSQGRLTKKSSLQPWLKPVRFVGELTPLSELLPLMQRSRSEMVVVVDEFGGTAGLITFTDLISEIVGDDVELPNSEEVAVQILNDQTFIVEAQMNVEEVNEILELDLPITDDYQTLGGFLLYQFQKIPSQGETLDYGYLSFTVVSAEGQRLQQIRIHSQEIA